MLGTLHISLLIREIHVNVSYFWLEMMHNMLVYVETKNISSRHHFSVLFSDCFISIIILTELLRNCGEREISNYL